MEFTVSSQLACDEREQVMHFKNDNAAIKNMRMNIGSRDENLVSNMEIILSDSFNEDFFSPTVKLNKDIVSAIIAVRPEYSKESIRGAVTKA